MSNPDRGAYAPPTDAPLAFDARQPVRGSQPVPVMLIVSALVLVALVVAIVVFYRSGARQAGSPPPVVGTPVGEIKTPAPASAQPVDPAAGLQIYQSAEGQPPPAAPNFTPPPEQPQPRTTINAIPAPVVVTRPPATARPEQVTVITPPVQPKVTPPVTRPAPALKPAVSAPAAPKPTAGGASIVQIGAFSSAALADKGWNDAARIAPGATAGKGKKVEAIQKDGATLYRTAVTGFATRAEAEAFCGQLKAAGKSCFVR